VGRGTRQNSLASNRIGGARLKPETLGLLLAADDPVNWEFPDGWCEEYPRAMERVRAVAADLERVLGLSFQLDDQVQDASFFADLAAIRLDANGKQECIFTIRFSAFGKLFTIWQWENTAIPASDLATVISIVRSHGFEYVDAEALEESYTGSHPGFRHATWWVRFFDYL
jgi:hypothetical protein